MLSESNSIRATARMAGVSVNAVLRLFAAAARFSSEYQDQRLRCLNCRRIQLDEIWGFVYAKQKNVSRAKAAPPQAGDVWTWVALCPDSKLVASWRVGDRSQETATEFVQDLEGRLAHRIQLTSDGYHAYINAVGEAFGDEVDYAMLAKIYAPSEVDQRKLVISGSPDPDHISTSLVERQNLTMRMSMRRFTRRINGFSKKMLNHAYSVALRFMHYNFIRVHGSLDGLTPAQAAGVADRPYTLSWFVDRVEQTQPKPNRPKAYRPRKKPLNSHRIQEDMIYIIIPIDDDRTTDADRALIREKIGAVTGEVFSEYAPQFYAAQYEGSAKDLSEELGFEKEPEHPRMVVVESSAEHIFGYASNRFWKWMAGHE